MLYSVLLFFFFFFNQKPAYDMRISDWSSDVCSSDLGVALPTGLDRYVELLGASASPCALVTIGLFLAQAQPGGSSATVGRLVAAKLLLQPAATAMLAFAVFPMPPLWAWCAVLMAALPIGTGPFMLAQMYVRDARATTRAIRLATAPTGNGNGRAWARAG